MSKIKNRELLERWKFSALKLNLGFLNVEFSPSDMDKNTAWAIYIELETRVTTQWLADDMGDEKTTLTSVYNVFTNTREILTNYGREAKFSTPIALAMLNYVIRPFTAKWHKKSVDGVFERNNNSLNRSIECLNFREELKSLQGVLIRFSAFFSAIAFGEADIVGVEKFMEDFTTYEEVGGLQNDL